MFSAEHPPSLTASLTGEAVQSIPYTLVQYSDYFTYKPTMESEKLRGELDRTVLEDMPIKFPQIQSLDYIQFLGKCYHYAIGVFLNTPISANQLSIIKTNSYEILLKYFDATLQPQKGDLAVYYKTMDDPVHFGIYLADNLIESKWGKWGVYRHAYFDVPSMYKKKIRFLKLKPGLTKEMFQTNLELDEKGRSLKAPVILKENEAGDHMLLLYSYKKPRSRYRPSPHSPGGALLPRSLCR